MQIYCENCGAEIPAAHINIQDKIAVCPQCNTVFSFADHLTRPAKLRKIKQPSNVIVVEQDNTLEIRFRWLRILKLEEHWFTFICGVGVALLTGLAVTMFDGMDSLLEGALGVGFALAALACLYLVFVIFINQVRITIDERTIHSVHGPLPFSKHSVDRADVARVGCELAVYNQDDPGSEVVDYNVQLVRHDGSAVTLVAVRRELALYISQTIEAYLEADDILYDEPDEENEPERLGWMADTGEEGTRARESSG